MLASRLHGLEDIRLDTVDDPDPGVGEVRVKVAHNGICGSDLHMYFRESPWRSGRVPSRWVTSSAVWSTGSAPECPGSSSGPGSRCGPSTSAAGAPAASAGSSTCCTPMKVLGCGAEGGGLAEYCVMDAEHGVRACPTP